MRKIKVIIFGTGQISSVAYTYIKQNKTVDICGFTVEKKYLKIDKFMDLPVVEFEKITEIYPKKKYKLFAPINYKNLNSNRERIFNKGKKLGYDFFSFIHPNCVNNSKKIGKNCFILENNVIQPFVEIEDNCILWSGNHIGHHSKIKSNTFISSHCVISGSVEIGNNCFLGVNSTIIDNIQIGNKNIIGAGCLVTKNTSSGLVVLGNASKPHPKLKSANIDL